MKWYDWLVAAVLVGIPLAAIGWIQWDCRRLKRKLRNLENDGDQKKNRYS